MGEFVDLTSFVAEADFSKEVSFGGGLEMGALSPQAIAAILGALVGGAIGVLAGSAMESRRQKADRKAKLRGAYSRLFSIRSIMAIDTQLVGELVAQNSPQDQRVVEPLAAALRLLNSHLYDFSEAGNELLFLERQPSRTEILRKIVNMSAGLYTLASRTLQFAVGRAAWEATIRESKELLDGLDPSHPGFERVKELQAGIEALTEKRNALAQEASATFVELAKKNRALDAAFQELQDHVKGEIERL